MYSMAAFGRFSRCGTTISFCDAHSCTKSPRCVSTQLKRCVIYCNRAVAGADLDGVAQRKVRRELQVPQAHARHRASAVALRQPALNAHPVIGVPRGNHNWVGHELLRRHSNVSLPQTHAGSYHRVSCEHFCGYPGVT